MAKKHWFLVATSGKVKGCRLIMRNGIRIHARLLKATLYLATSTSMYYGQHSAEWSYLHQPGASHQSFKTCHAAIVLVSNGLISWRKSKWTPSGWPHMITTCNPVLIFDFHAEKYHNSVNYVLNLFIFGHMTKNILVWKIKFWWVCCRTWYIFYGYNLE